eukprot:TRINITY_DN3444_c0_g1_i5.p1 TRINITY_DN3444_c0_g1~~TRINITY_DN3444_c0_g1_i5.p1  ORF type:complete len:126 (+),score=36.57 TRINITY_DN3444_c0_g1_i5:48-380(+)
MCCLTEERKRAIVVELEKESGLHFDASQVSKLPENILLNGKEAIASAAVEIAMANRGDVVPRVCGLFSLSLSFLLYVYLALLISLSLSLSLSCFAPSLSRSIMQHERIRN